MRKERIIKSKATLIVSYFEKTNDKLIRCDEITTRISGKEFMNSINEDREKGIDHKIEVVSEKPERFQMGVIYVRADGKMIWTHQLNG